MERLLPPFAAPEPPRLTPPGQLHAVRDFFNPHPIAKNQKKERPLNDRPFIRSFEKGIIELMNYPLYQPHLSASLSL